MAAPPRSFPLWGRPAMHASRDDGVHVARAGAREQVDARSDIFSFGVLMHEMIAGVLRSPADAAETLSAILNDSAPRWCLSGVGRHRHCRTTFSASDGSCSSKTGTRAIRASRTSRWICVSFVRQVSGRCVGPINSAPHVSLLGSPRPTVVGPARVRGWPPSARSPSPRSRGGCRGRRASEARGIGAGVGRRSPSWVREPERRRRHRVADEGVPAMLITGLAQTRGLDVVSSSRLDEVIKAAGYGDLDPSTRADGWRSRAARAPAPSSPAACSERVATCGSTSLSRKHQRRVVLAQSVRGPDVFRGRRPCVANRPRDARRRSSRGAPGCRRHVALARGVPAVHGGRRGAEKNIASPTPSRSRKGRGDRSGFAIA